MKKTTLDKIFEQQWLSIRNRLKIDHLKNVIDVSVDKKTK